MEIGDYVRFYDRDWTEIGQIVDEVEDSHLKVVKCKDDYYDLDNFIKSSPNIIDLLETGDIIHYQNEYIDFISPVIVYDDGEIASNLYDSDGYIFLDKEIDENNIKSIVTKEQFERMKYKVGD